MCNTTEEHSRRLQELNAPSWSWLSVYGPVCFLANHLSPSLEVVNVEVKLKNSQASFGDVKLGHVTVKGLIKHPMENMVKTRVEDSHLPRPTSYDDITKCSPNASLNFILYGSQDAINPSLKRRWYDDTMRCSSNLLLKLGQYKSIDVEARSMAVCIVIEKQANCLWARSGICIVPDSSWLGLSTVTIQ